MKAPDKLYLHPNHKDEVGANWLTFPLFDSDVKYIRADLAELTWEDIKKICDCFMDVGLHSELPARTKAFYQEVLRRFYEYKQNAREARSGTRKGEQDFVR